MMDNLKQWWTLDANLYLPVIQPRRSSSGRKGLTSVRPVRPVGMVQYIDTIDLKSTLRESTSLSPQAPAHRRNRAHPGSPHLGMPGLGNCNSLVQWAAP